MRLLEESFVYKLVPKLDFIALRPCQLFLRVANLQLLQTIQPLMF